MRHSRWLASLLFIALAACGGADPHDLVSGTAPLWVTETDLPGCETAMMAPGQVEAWIHPLDPELVVVTRAGTPTCIGLKSSVLQSMGVAPTTLHEGQADDDPIPLVRENENGSEDDPVPQKHVELASPPSDDPIPLVRPRDPQATVTILPGKTL